MFEQNSPAFTDAFTTGLACAAINPGLRSVLIFDAPPAGFQRAAQTLAHLLAAVTGTAVKQSMLPVHASEDDLWGQLALRQYVDHPALLWQQGHLLESSDDSFMRLLLISDLTQASLATVRACVSLIGANVAHLERHGQHKRWQPTLCWLAHCASAEVGAISPHLLDRFALRLRWPSSGRSDLETDLLEQVLTQADEERPAQALPAETRAWLIKAAGQRATPTPAALEQVLSYTSHARVCTPRRELALARYALSIAQFEGRAEVLVSDVDTAARLIGLASSQEAGRATSGPGAKTAPGSDDGRQTEQGERRELEPDDTGESVSSENKPESARDPIYLPEETRALGATTVSGDPYPEDSAPIEREATPLRLPLFRRAWARAGRGIIIGVEKADSLQDLALVSTILAAAPFQPIRRKHLGGQSERLLLSSADARCYRREPAPEHLLLLLLDYTGLRHCNWQAALLPYLRKAYTERAKIGIVQVGIATAAHELRAELVSARSILVPGISAAFAASAGRATPLAHGFDLVLRALRHALQHGRSPARHALLIVVSDGRGNVPLEASRNGRILPPVSREGVEDALRLAQLIPQIKGVQTLVLNPQPRQYQDLPITLAHALGAPIQNIPLLTDEEAW